MKVEIREEDLVNWKTVGRNRRMQDIIEHYVEDNYPGHSIVTVIRDYDSRVVTLKLKKNDE